MTTKVLDIRLNDDVLEWFQLHGNTTKVKMWGEKLQRIADKLQFTNEQEKLKNKIERYLNRVPSQFSECDDDRREFRKQLPEQLIRRLRRFYSKNKQKDPLNIYHVEMPNYYSKIRTNQDELRSVLRSWLKTIYFKRRDFLGRPIRRDDVIDFIEYKLQPFITDKSNSEQEYKYVLKSKIIEAVNELPVAISGECLDRQADKLIEEILNVTNIAFENKDNKKNFKNKHIRPAIKEIKDFITDQILQYLEQNNITLRASKIFRLEMDLTDILTDLYDTSGIRDSVNVKRRVLKVMRKIGKLTMIRAVDFTDTLINNFRKTYYTVNNNLSNYMPHECYSVYVQNRSSKRQHAGDLCIGDVRRSSHALKGVNYYNKQLVHQINEWLKDIQVPKQNKASKDTAVKQLAADIVDRHKYLELNPDSRGTEPEELEHLKFQIFKWINNLVGEDNKTTLERAPDLMNRIQSVPVPLLSSQQRSQNYVSHLTDVIFEWYHDLPTHLHSSDDETMRKQNVKNLAENIEKAMKTKKSVNETVNKEVNIWTKKVFMIQPDSLTIDQLKVKLKAVLNKDENNLDKDTKQEKLYIRRYEDVIDDWLDTFPLEPKREASFINIRNEYSHDLAVKLHNSRTKLENASPDVLNKKLQEEVSDWLKKIPLHQQTNKKAFRDQFSGRLIRKILESNQEESLEMREKVDSTQFSDTQLEDALIDWLKTLPLYREKSITEKQKQEKIMSELAKRLNSALHGHSNCNPDLEIENHVKMLGLVFLNDREYVQKTALQLKLHLQNLNFFADISQRKDPNDDEFLDANIEVWMRNLPLNVPSDVERRELENKKKAFAKTMKELKANRANDDVLIGEIVNFMKTLPLSKTDDFFLKEEANMLIKSLYAVAMGHVPRNKPPTSNEFVRDVISNWSVLLPLKPIYSPVELRSLIDQMTREITDQIVTPDHSVEEKIKQKTLDYLRKFPIKPERRDEQQLEKMALALLNDIKDVQLYRSDYSGEINKPIDNQQSKNSNDVIPPKLSTQSDSEKENVGPNLDEYMIRLTTEIKEWLNDLRGQIPEIHDKSFREIAINDLAGDIVDRHKYLELNPTIRGSDEDELEHLKYQIFKWINKLVGEDNLVTIEHASELMDKIRSISTPVSATTIMRGNPVMASTPAIEPPLNNEVCVDAIDAKKLPPKNQSEAARDRNHVKAQINGPASEHAQSMTPKRSSNNESREGTCQTVPNRGPSMHNETTSHTLTCVSEGKDVILTTHDIQVGQTSTSTATYDAGSMIYSQETLTDRVNPSTQKNASQVFRPSYLDLEGSIDESPREIKSTPNTNQASTQLPIVSPRRSSSEIVSQKSQPYEVGSPRKDSHPENFPPGMTVIEVHKQYDGIIRELCAQLPFKADTPDEERIADLARKGVYNTIWKTYFKFKSDPELENDYVYMEFLLEGTIDDCLDIVTNSEIENMRQAWKGKMILHVMDMIKCVQSISDTPSFREQLGNKMDRLFTKELFSEVEYQVSQMFISRIAESYILYANYKYEDPVKANIYRHRLMKRLEVFVQEQTKLHNKEFRKLDDVKMCQKAFKILESIPLPTNDVLKAEADEVLLNEEIESWYHDLPVQPLESQHDERFRRRMLEVLAKKIREMEKRPGIDESSLQMEMKHEMSVFLKKRARLQKDEDLNINFMVDELTNRLKNRKNREINYEGFQKDVPLSSTFEEMESVDALAPLVDCRPLSQIGNGCGSGCRRRSRRGILGTSQVNAQSNQYISEQPLMQPMNQHSSFSNPTFEYKSFDGITQSAGLSNMNQMPTQQYDQNSGYTSTYYPYAQSHSCMQQQNQMPLEYAFSPNQMPQMAPYPGQEPHLNVSEYSTRLTPDGIVSNLQQPVQFTRSSLPKQMPSYPYLGAEMPGVKATPLSARVSDVIMSRDIPDVNMQMEEEEMRDNEREESRCRCVEYCRRRRTRICIPYNDRRRCYPSYPMPMPFPFNCFY